MWRGPCVYVPVVLRAASAGSSREPLWRRDQSINAGSIDGVDPITALIFVVPLVSSIDGQNYGGQRVACKKKLGTPPPPQRILGSREWVYPVAGPGRLRIRMRQHGYSQQESTCLTPSPYRSGAQVCVELWSCGVNMIYSSTPALQHYGIQYCTVPRTAYRYSTVLALSSHSHYCILYKTVL